MKNEELKRIVFKTIEKNLNLPAKEIKEKLKKQIPDITNEQVIDLIIEINKINRKRNNIENKKIKRSQKEDIER